MKRGFAIFILTMVCAASVSAQKNEGAIKVSPNGVNVNASGSTTVFLTFGGLSQHRPAEGTWCGELIPAAPDRGFKCDPMTVYGMLPDRYDLATSSGRNALTDIMSIPPSVARRAYQDAQAGLKSSFFYVRRFVSLKGGPDEYVFVTCRMAGGGVSVPLALTGVRLSFPNAEGVLFVKPGEKLQPFKAEISYNGTGRLAGRWELVLPGDDLPTEFDLLTEATLPVEQRGSQRRYLQLSRFNIFLPPVGKYSLAGPDPANIPIDLAGAFQILLRIEVSEDQDSGSNLATLGAGSGFIQTGAVAGFPLPVLRYFVGTKGPDVPAMNLTLTLIAPNESAVIEAEPVFSWVEVVQAAVCRLEIVNSNGEELLSALLRPGVFSYQAPTWLKEKAGPGPLRWRVIAYGTNGEVLGESEWRKLELLRL